MRLLPSHELLAIWRATVNASLRDGRWTWGGRHGRDSLSDAEQLLCILAPATLLTALRLDRQDTKPAALDALQRLGDTVEIPRTVITLLQEYFDRYTDPGGAPVFAASGYLSSAEPGTVPTAQQQSLAVVASYATTVKLSLAAIGFARLMRTWVRSEQLRSKIDMVEQSASTRLSAAMVGLLRSFCINTFDATSRQGVALRSNLANDDLPAEHVPVARLRRDLRDVIAGFGEVSIGSGEAMDLDQPDRLFECGWSWGVIKDAPSVYTIEPIGAQPDGTAFPAPYLHFTVAAMGAITQLFYERTRILGLLNEEQARLGRALQLRYDLTKNYWATVATFGDADWPLDNKDSPTTDNVESDSFSLLVASLTINGLTERRTLQSANRDTSDDDWSRLAAVLAEMASRGRIIRRPLVNDPALAFHSPENKIVLISEAIDGGPRLQWTINDYAPMLLECAAQALMSIRDTDQRRQLSHLVDQIWLHLERRRIADGP